MFQLFSSDFSAAIVVPADVQACVKLAARDLQRDLRRLSGQSGGFPLVHSGRGITVCVDAAAAPDHPEGYRITVVERGVTITGADALGAVYGIYTFAEKCLGIDPLQYFTDVFPVQRAALALESTVLESREKTCRFRGWFINDEDFLTGFAPSGAKRAITYNQPFFKEVISVEMMDKIFEAALRLGMNTIIPCSFVDILNPAEEAIVEQAVKRGLYVSQHHQEPVGVAYFAAENYMKQHFPGKAVSYVRSPAEMETVWHTYIEKWAKYGSNVIWQLGLRGKGDVAVWRTDGSVGSSAQKRGRIISKAIATQHSMIAQTLGHTDFLSTSTLWLEGAALYDAGHLQLPKSTVVVFSDIGINQLWGEDFYSVTRRADTKYGIYYHAGFYADGPHYADGTDPKKMVFCYREAEKYSSLYFSVLNVANIRELTGSIRLNGALVAQSPADLDLDTYYKTVYPTIYGDAAETVAKLDKAYFAAFGDLGEELGKQIISYTDFHYHSYPGTLDFPRYPLTDGALARLGTFFTGYRCRDVMKPYMENKENFCFLQRVLEESEKRFAHLAVQISEKASAIPENAREYYRFSQQWRVQAMLQLTRWALQLSYMCQGDRVGERRTHALAAMEQMCSVRQEVSRGKWEGWYDCDQRLPLTLRMELARQYPHNERECKSAV